MPIRRKFTIYIIKKRIPLFLLFVVRMLIMIDTRGRFTLHHALFTIGVIGGIACVVYAIIGNRKSFDKQRKHR